MNIDYKDLVLWDWENSSENSQKLAKSVLQWAEEQLLRETFPREDYKEFMQLVVISLGGKIPGFAFRLPQNDSNARWMAKAIYNLKIRLLSKVFVMTTEEAIFVQRISEFVMVFYCRYWFTGSLPCAAPREDLDFLNSIEEYRKTDPKLFWALSRSVYNHLWYVTPQLVILGLFDKELESATKEEMAKVLHQTPRGFIPLGKPNFPIMAPGVRTSMADLIGPESWLLFELFDLEGPQDWLLAPSCTWHLSPNFIKLEEFAKTLVVVNDLAERGCHLATEFINRVQDEEQRQALMQHVEDFRKKVKNLNKENLKLC